LGSSGIYGVKRPLTITQFARMGGKARAAKLSAKRPQRDRIGSRKKKVSEVGLEASVGSGAFPESMWRRLLSHAHRRRRSVSADGLGPIGQSAEVASVT
jgi:hypothetical protein